MAFRMSHESLQGSGSQGSMAMDLHLDCPVTLRVRDKRRNQLRRQRRVDEDERQPAQDESRRNSHSCSPRLPPSHHHKDFNSTHPMTGMWTITEEYSNQIVGTCFSLLLIFFRWFRTSIANAFVVIVNALQHVE